MGDSSKGSNTLLRIQQFNPQYQLLFQYHCWTKQYSIAQTEHQNLVHDTIWSIVGINSQASCFKLQIFNTLKKTGNIVLVLNSSILLAAIASQGSQVTS